jgi:hypothetical protein
MSLFAKHAEEVTGCLSGFECLGNAVKLDLGALKCRRKLTISLLRTTK